MNVLRTITLAAVVLLPAASAGSLVTSLASLGANDTVNWGQLGPVGTSPSNPFTAVSGLGGVTVTVANLGDGGIPTATSQLSNASTYGLPGTLPVLDDQFLGPVTIGFSIPVTGVGFYLADAFGAGPFVSATIQEFDGNTSLGSFTEPATPGSAILFIGVLDASADVTKIEISTADNSGDNYFAIDTLNLSDAAPVNQIAPSTPEPSTLILTGVALAVVVGRRGFARRM
jgi:hypothetical protein